MIAPAKGHITLGQGRWKEWKTRQQQGYLGTTDSLKAKRCCFSFSAAEPGVALQLCLIYLTSFRHHKQPLPLNRGHVAQNWQLPWAVCNTSWSSGSSSNYAVIRNHLLQTSAPSSCSQSACDSVCFPCCNFSGTVTLYLLTLLWLLEDLILIDILLF